MPIIGESFTGQGLEYLLPECLQKTFEAITLLRSVKDHSSFDPIIIFGKNGKIATWENTAAKAHCTKYFVYYIDPDETKCKIIAEQLDLLEAHRTAIACSMLYGVPCADAWELNQIIMGDYSGLPVTLQNSTMHYRQQKLSDVYNSVDLAGVEGDHNTYYPQVKQAEQNAGNADSISTDQGLADILNRFAGIKTDINSLKQLSKLYMSQNDLELSDIFGKSYMSQDDLELSDIFGKSQESNMTASVQASNHRDNRILSQEAAYGALAEALKADGYWLETYSSINGIRGFKFASKQIVGSSYFPMPDMNFKLHANPLCMFDVAGNDPLELPIPITNAQIKFVLEQLRFFSADAGHKIAEKQDESRYVKEYPDSLKAAEDTQELPS